MANISTPCSPPFHVIALDMDGTLLNPDHEITDFTKKTIQDVVAKYPTQVFVALASGRHYADLKPILDSLELPEESGAIIACNGACAYAFNTNNAFNEKDKVNEEQKVHPDRKLKCDLIQIRNVCIPPESVCQVLSMWLNFDNKDINLHIYQNDHWLCAMEEKEILEYSNISGFVYELCNLSELVQAYNEHQKLSLGACGDDSTSDGYNSTSPINPLDGIPKIFVSSKNPELLAEFRSRVQAAIPCLSLTFSSKCFLEIMGTDVSKFTGLQSLMPHVQAYAATKKSVGDSKDNKTGKTEGQSEAPWTVESVCLAFGDNENDVSMIRNAARGCLMGNGPEALKESLKNDVVVVGTNYEDGVAHELKKIFNV
ncbi:unnamed protein product [Phytomonas sp. EM1]|nr:unnamed protein product [Phytomonas sp. EM1]|eukprot:CCW62230.1 unnamed protein product [Phytomonas sp. isolate EM1]